MADLPAIRARTVAARITHGRHCICSACARQDWAEPNLAACGMHGPDCPPVYAPLGAAGAAVSVQTGEEADAVVSQPADPAEETR